MKKVIQFAVEYPITILMVVFAVLLLGIISFQKLGMDLFPEMENPRIFVELKAGERPPEEIENQFVTSIESQAIRQKNAVQVSSISQVGAAQLTIEYAWGTSMDEAFLSLQRALSGFQQNDEIDELNITQHDPNATPVILLGFSHPEITDMDELRKVAESYIRNDLIRLEGIADVRMMGHEEKEVVIETNQYLLDAFGLTTSGLANQIKQYNSNISGGSIVEMGQKYIIQGISEFSSFEDIEQVVVAYKQPEGQSEAESDTKVPVYLKDVAEITLLNKKPDNIVRINQSRCMALAVYKETRYNTVKAVDEFMETLEIIRNRLPGYELSVIQNKGEFITNAIDEVQKALLYGILFAVIILYVFLRRVGTTTIISLAIPISIVATFNLMYFNGLTLNIMTLGGLALGAGMLVDNSIVVMENIFRNLETGRSLKESILLGTSQVSGAITAATITTIVVFLPIVYLRGSEGELFKDQAWTVAFSLFSSLWVAILVIPMLSKRLLKDDKERSSPLETSRPASIRFPRYANFLRGVLRIKWLVILMAAVLVAIAIRLIPIVGSEFIPKTNLNEFTIEIRLPEGTELYRTESTVTGIEKNISAILGDEIETLYSVAGPSWEMSGGISSIFQGENTATLKVILKKDCRIPIDNVFNAISGMLDEIPELETNIFQEQTALELTIGTETAPLIIEIQGDDLEQIQELAEQTKEQALTCNELYNIETSFEVGRPEINIMLDPFRAAVYNISIQNLISQLQTLLMGANSGQLDKDGELMDITIALPRVSVSKIDEIIITGGSNEISLYSVADIETSQSPVAIYRRNQVRIGQVTAQINTDIPLDHVVQKINTVMSEITFPPEYEFQITGEEQKREEAFKNLRFALILSLILVYMVLASQFESLVHPFTIILSIPLAIVGAVAIFFFMGKSFNIMAFIGIIMLVGIAVNDSIILVDAINQLKREGLSRIEAIIEAGQRRIRPIIMTSMTTILALLPLTFGFGEGAALRAPMALAVIGGLITATILTLIVIPCVYAVMDRINENIFSR